MAWERPWAVLAVEVAWRACFRTSCQVLAGISRLLQLTPCGGRASPRPILGDGDAEIPDAPPADDDTADKEQAADELETLEAAVAKAKVPAAPYALVAVAKAAAAPGGGAKAASKKGNKGAAK